MKYMRKIWDNNSKLLTLVLMSNPSTFPYINNNVTNYFTTDVIKASFISGLNKECILEYTGTRVDSGNTYSVYTAEIGSLEIFNYMASAYSNHREVAFAFYADPNRME